MYNQSFFDTVRGQNLLESIDNSLKRIADVIEKRSEFTKKSFDGINDFLNVKTGDIVICYDEYGHDYVEHKLKITSVEYDDEYKTDTNPDGKVCYGDELDKEAFGDDYLTVVTESNFTGIIGERE